MPDLPAPARVVSLVPSDTFSIAALGASSRLAGRTKFCVEPDSIRGVPAFGGTKKLEVDAIVRLAPDLVLANREENSREDVLRLIDAGLRVHVSFPRTVDEGFDHLELIASLLGVRDEPYAARLIGRANALRASLRAASPSLSCFVPIWRRPWMTVSGETYLSDVLRVLGLANVFASHPSADRDGKDTRYPVVTLDEVESRQPACVLLPDEPYPFKDSHAEEFEGMDIPAARTGLVLCVSGRDLCWHGAWAVDGIPRLRDRIRMCSLVADL